MTTYVQNETTYSTLVTERNYFTDRPLRFSVDPRHNTIPSGKYRVKDGRLEQIDEGKVTKKTAD
jgi:hypothetical protein